MNSTPTNFRAIDFAAAVAFLLASIMLFAAAPSAFAQSPNQLRLTIVDGNNQQVSAGQVLPKRFTVRATNELGQPYAGMRITFMDRKSCETRERLCVGHF